MGSITAASPTLYTMFCKATGYGGTTQRADSNTRQGARPHDDGALRFQRCAGPCLGPSSPTSAKMDVKIGETALAFFRATNNSDKPVKGQATFNVTPEAFGAYFNKIECFCFKEQTLQPHQTVEMPVTFFLDPKMVEDSSTAALSEVTLSYSFFPVEHPAATADGCAACRRRGAEDECRLKKARKRIEGRDGARNRRVELSIQARRPEPEGDGDGNG